MARTLLNPNVINLNRPWIMSYASTSSILSGYTSLLIVLSNHSPHTGSHEPRPKVVRLGRNSIHSQKQTLTRARNITIAVKSRLILWRPLLVIILPQNPSEGENIPKFQMARIPCSSPTALSAKVTQTRNPPRPVQLYCFHRLHRPCR